MTAYVDKNVLLEAMAKLQPSAEEYGSTDNRNKIAELEDAAYWTARDLYDDIKTMIAVIDSADVAPVVHGRWNCGDDMFEYAICSACEWDSGEAWEYAKKNFKFCPHCGAKMGESEE